MNNETFKAFLDLLMRLDPYPIEGEEGIHNNALMLVYADAQAEIRGFDSWEVAFHEFDRTDNMEKLSNEAQYPVVDNVPEIFPGTTEALERLGK